MATNKISMQYDLKQNSNEDSTAFGKWYPRAVVLSTLNLRGLAAHIAEHGSIYTEDVVYGVLSKFTSCMLELVKQGVAVKLDGLGKFYPTLEAKGAETPVNYNLESYLQGVHIRYLPEGSEANSSHGDITSRKLKKSVIFEQRMIWDKNGKPKRIVDGQVVDYGDGE